MARAADTSEMLEHAFPDNSSERGAGGSTERASRPTPVSRAARKIVQLDDLLAKRRQCGTMGLKIVHCHGCFDIVHPGHIRHLRQARAQGDLLLVSITSDETFGKRGGKPLIPEHLRAENLAELDCVDLVLIDRHDTASELLARVKPDVFVKGKEYETNSDPRFAQERQIVEAAGGRVVFTSGDVVFSSTALIGTLERAMDPFHARISHLAADERLSRMNLQRTIDGFRNKRVLVIGESILDTYVHCDQPEVAAESPVMTLRPVGRTMYDGGAAVIARHLRHLGAQVSLLTGLPQSAGGEAMHHRLTAEAIAVESVTLSGELAEKQRFLVGQQKVMKLNVLSPIVLDAAVQDSILGKACEIAAGGVDAVIIADFGNGFLSSPLITRLCRALREKTGVLAGDISGRRGNLAAFTNADLLTPGEQEARDALRCYDAGLSALAWHLLSTTATRGAILKLGPEGCVACTQTPVADLSVATLKMAIGGVSDDGEFKSRISTEHVPSLGAIPLDPLGCGDAMLAAATLSLATGGDMLMAAVIGSLAAAVHAGRMGNPALASGDLLAATSRLVPPRLAMTTNSRGVAAAG